MKKTFPVCVLALFLLVGCTMPKTQEGQMLLAVDRYTKVLNTLVILRQEGQISDEAYKELRVVTDRAKRLVAQWRQGGIGNDKLLDTLVAQIMAAIIEIERKRDVQSYFTPPHGGDGFSNYV